MENIVAGTTININRSDGRVHEAIVVAVNMEGNFVRVEWLENEETKGKDIDFNVVSMLNPQILQQKKPETPKLEELDIVNVDDTMVNKSLRKIPINVKNKRALTVKRYTQQFGNENNSTHQIGKLYTTRSSSRPVTNPSGLMNEITKLEKGRVERRQKQALIVNEKMENKRRTQNEPFWKLSTMIRDYREKINFNPIMDTDECVDHQIAVCVRKRPLNKHELCKKEIDIVTIPRKNQLIVHEPKTKVDLTKYIENHTFKFDYAFDESCDNALVYKYTAQPLVKTIFEGGFATCFAYGQTGSGKTYTMSGDFNGEELGVYALAVSDVFQCVKSPKYRHLNLTVSCAFFEIYSGRVLDLLNNKSVLKILEDGKQQVQVVGLTENLVNNTDEVMGLINKGNVVRTSGQTSANSNSSRSHAVFQIYLRNRGKVHGKFSLIDLAGNERGADTFSSDRQTRLEGGEINKSLLALKECIRALGRKGAHLPFRVSKLTQVLRDSFVGNNSRTCMIAMVSPSVCSCENTLNTLRYADRVKELGTAPDQPLTELELSPKMKVIPEVLSGNEDMDVDESLSLDLQLAECKLLENHKYVMQQLNDVTRKGSNLLNSISSNNNEFDKRKYVEKFENLIDDSIAQLLNTKDYIDDFKSKLNSL